MCHMDLCTNTCAWGHWTYSVLSGKNHRAVRCYYSPTLSVFLLLALQKGDVEYVCMADSTSGRPHRLKVCLGKEKHNPIVNVSILERGSVLTSHMCALTLPCLLCLLAFGNLLWCQWAVTEVMNLPSVKDSKICARNKLSEMDAYFFTIPYMLQISTGNQSVCPSAFQLHCSGNECWHEMIRWGNVSTRLFKEPTIPGSDGLNPQVTIWAAIHILDSNRKDKTTFKNSSPKCLKPSGWLQKFPFKRLQQLTIIIPSFFFLHRLCKW